jgi:hypothetical protein
MAEVSTREVTAHTDTEMAQDQTKVLQRTLSRFDIVFLIVSAVVGLEMLGSVSAQGPQTFTWLVVLIVVFLVPYALIFAETGSAFVGEGGVYLWTRKAFGRPAAAVASAFTWITQPVWVGGSMSFLNAEAARNHIVHFAQGSGADYAFKLVFIWLTVLAAILSLKKAKWIPTAGAFFKISFLALFIVTAAIYAMHNGVRPLTLGSFSPTLQGFITLTPLLLFAFLGFESSSSASGEMKNAQHDVAISVLRSSAMAGIFYLIPVFTILLVVPPSRIDGVSGLLNAVAAVFAVYGPASGAMMALAVGLFMCANIGQGAAWMIMSDRMQAMAAGRWLLLRRILREVPPDSGHPGAGQPAVGHRVDAVHAGGDAAHRLLGVPVQCGARSGHHHLPVQLPAHHPGRREAEAAIPRRRAAVPGARTELGVRGDVRHHDGAGGLRLLGDGVSGHPGGPARDAARLLPGLRRLLRRLRGADPGHHRLHRGALHDRLSARGAAAADLRLLRLLAGPSRTPRARRRDRGHPGWRSLPPRRPAALPGLNYGEAGVKSTADQANYQDAAPSTGIWARPRRTASASNCSSRLRSLGEGFPPYSISMKSD